MEIMTIGQGMGEGALDGFEFSLQASLSEITTWNTPLF